MNTRPSCPVASWHLLVEGGVDARTSSLRRVQPVAVDGPAQKPHDADMLGKAIKRQLTATKVTPAELARRLGVADSTVSRLVAGQIEDVTIGRVLQIEAVLGLPRGHLFRSARMVDDALTVRQRI